MLPLGQHNEEVGVASGEVANGEVPGGECKVEEINEEICSVSSVGTYEDSELAGPHSEWVVVARECQRLMVVT